MNTVFKIIPVLLFMLVMYSCTQPIADENAYNYNSWKSMIPDTCLSFYDGCNNCRRNKPGGVAACTRKACDKYEKPVCLDKTNQGK
jgi:hypothetical protein